MLTAGTVKRYPPAYASRWAVYRVGPTGSKHPRALDVHLGWDGKSWAASCPNSVWLPPDRDPEHTDWRCARNTRPTVYAHDADEAHCLAVAHALLAAGVELVVLFHGGRRHLYDNFAARTPST